MDNETQVGITRDEAADWLVRSALPRFLELVEMGDEATYFRSLSPYQGHTATGRIRGWQGARARVVHAERNLNSMFGKLVEQYPVDMGREPTLAEDEVHKAIVFARSVLSPSQLGGDAHRVIALSSRIVLAVTRLLRDTGQPEVDDAWRDAWHAITDRAQLRSHVA